jgi:hypothetical protein
VLGWAIAAPAENMMMATKIVRTMFFLLLARVESCFTGVCLHLLRSIGQIYGPQQYHVYFQLSRLGLFNQEVLEVCID